MASSRSCVKSSKPSRAMRQFREGPAVCLARLQSQDLLRRRVERLDPPAQPDNQHAVAEVVEHLAMDVRHGHRPTCSTLMPHPSLVLPDVRSSPAGATARYRIGLTVPGDHEAAKRSASVRPGQSPSSEGNCSRIDRWRGGSRPQYWGDLEVRFGSAPGTRGRRDQRLDPGAPAGDNTSRTKSAGRDRKHQYPWGQSSLHRRLNLQTSTSNARSPFRRKTASPFDPTDFGASQAGETGSPGTHVPTVRGLSPRWRGDVLADWRSMRFVRSIPALAGEHNSQSYKGH